MGNKKRILALVEELSKSNKELQEQVAKLMKKEQTYQNEKEYKVDEWLFFSEGFAKGILRFKGYQMDHKIKYVQYQESYQITNSGYSDYVISEHHNFTLLKDCRNIRRKATDKEVKEILITVAKHKGFNAGVRIKILVDSCKGEISKCKLSGNFEFIGINELRMRNDSEIFTIYSNGEWAEVVAHEIPAFSHLTQIKNSVI